MPGTTKYTVDLQVKDKALQTFVMTPSREIMVAIREALVNGQEESLRMNFDSKNVPVSMDLSRTTEGGAAFNFAHPNVVSKPTFLVQQLPKKVLKRVSEIHHRIRGVFVPTDKPIHTHGQPPESKRTMEPPTWARVGAAAEAAFAEKVSSYENRKNALQKKTKPPSVAVTAAATAHKTSTTTSSRSSSSSYPAVESEGRGELQRAEVTRAGEGSGGYSPPSSASPGGYVAANSLGSYSPPSSTPSASAPSPAQRVSYEDDQYPSYGSGNGYDDLPAVISEEVGLDEGEGDLSGYDYRLDAFDGDSGGKALELPKIPHVWVVPALRKEIRRLTFGGLGSGSVRNLEEFKAVKSLGLERVALKNKISDILSVASSHFKSLQALLENASFDCLDELVEHLKGVISRHSKIIRPHFQDMQNGIQELDTLILKDIKAAKQWMHGMRDRPA